MELMLTREKLRFLRPVAQGGEQVTIEGEATLAGSMRDAVTVLSVQAQAHLTGRKATAGGVSLKGQVQFQVLYTQGDLTRVRTLETECDFEHDMKLDGVKPGMRVLGACSVLRTEGGAGSGRMTLRAVLEVQAAVLADCETDYITQAECCDAPCGLQSRSQLVECCRSEVLGDGSTLLREEFDLPQKLGAGDVLGMSAELALGDLAGGNGRVNITGIVRVRTTHRPEESGGTFVTVDNELPFEMTVETPGWDGSDGRMPTVEAEITDVMADCASGDKKRTLRLEAEVRAAVSLADRQEAELLEDIYSTGGAVLEPVFEETEMLVSEEDIDTRESLRLQATLPGDAPPMETVLTAFAQPTLTALQSAGRRLDAEGIMNITLIYLPQDSDIPYSVTLREPFSMTFPAEADDLMLPTLRIIQTDIGAATSDRAELRLVLGLRARRQRSRKLRAIREIEQREEVPQEHGFVIVWPKAGETTWEIAKRLRVAEGSLTKTGCEAMATFKA